MRNLLTLSVSEWLNLEVIEIMSLNSLPNGKRLLTPTEEELATNDVLDWEDLNPCDLEEIPYRRSILNTEICHRAFISFRYAAQRMPRLELGGKRTVYWSGENAATEGYRPDERVAGAWGLGLEDLKPIPYGYRGCAVEFQRWPPGTG
ncbi:hypothetical protein BDV19DRAFT_370402 [Aspergillus venezuelensis]